MLRALAALMVLAALIAARMYTQGYYFRHLNPANWALRLRGVYDYDAAHGILRQARTDDKVVALTFDDGPHASTPELLEVFRRYDAQATFFLVGKNVVEHPDLARLYLAGGHDIGNHTRSHLRLPDLRTDQIRAELNNDTIVIARATGKRVRLFRPPGGEYDDRVTEEAAREGMLTVLWSNNTGDYTEHSPTWLENRVLSDLEPGDIILMHEDQPTTIAALPGILAGLHARGYRAVTVSELLRITGIPLPPLPKP